jgi:hypothetical protein
MRKLRYYIGMKADLGGNAIIFGTDSDGPFIKAVGPDAHTLKKSKDSPPPQRKSRGRLIERSPKLLKLSVPEVWPLAANA